MARPKVDTAALKGLSGTAAPGVEEDSGFFDVDFNLGETLNTVSLGAIPSDTGGEIVASVSPATTALNAVDKIETNTAAQQRVMSILEGANIDVASPLTQSWLAVMADTAGANANETQKWRAVLNLLTVAGGELGIQSFLDQYPDASLIRVTPYSTELAENAFTEGYGALFTPTEQANTGMREGGSLAAPTTPDYETSEQTGAIRFANGTIVTESGGIIYDPSKSAPGSQAYLRAAANWDEVKLEKWKQKFVSLGYMSKEDAKVPGFTVGFRQTLSTYWGNYYNNGGREIAADAPGGSSGATLNDPIDYQEYSAEARNNMRTQLKNILGVEPTEEQIQAQVRYVLRTATELQTKFRKKGNRGNLGTQYDQATEQAIDNIESSPYAEDVRENTTLRDSLSNAAYVSRSLLS